MSCNTGWSSSRLRTGESARSAWPMAASMHEISRSGSPPARATLQRFVRRSPQPSTLPRRPSLLQHARHSGCHADDWPAIQLSPCPHDPSPSSSGGPHADRAAHSPLHSVCTGMRAAGRAGTVGIESCDRLRLHLLTLPISLHPAAIRCGTALCRPCRCCSGTCQGQEPTYSPAASRITDTG